MGCGSAAATRQQRQPTCKVPTPSQPPRLPPPNFALRCTRQASPSSVRPAACPAAPPWRRAAMCQPPAKPLPRALRPLLAATKQAQRGCRRPISPQQLPGTPASATLQPQPNSTPRPTPLQATLPATGSRLPSTNGLSELKRQVEMHKGVRLAAPTHRHVGSDSHVQRG